MEHRSFSSLFGYSILGVMFLIVLPIQGFAQKLYIRVSENDAELVEQLTRKFTPQLHRLSPDTLLLKTADSVALDSAARKLLRHLRSNSYLAASLDSLFFHNDSTATARLYLGPALRWLRLRPSDDMDDRWLDGVRFREKQFSDKLFFYEAVLRLERQVLTQAENSGYPFASVHLDSIQFDTSGALSAELRIAPGPYFLFTDLKINGNLRLPKSYLPRYLGLRPGTPYSRARVLRIRDRLNSLLFVETLANPTVTFAGNEARVNLFLQKKRASRFDFIIGLLPRSENQANDGRLLLTGSLSAAFLNALNLGERLSIELERLKPETQKLDVQAGLPYLFGLPFGVEGRLNIFRRDSTWLDAQSEIGVQYLLEGGNFVKFFWENKSSSLQKIDTVAVIQNRRLPDALDLQQNGFGLEANLNRLDYRFNPRKGLFANLRAVAGFNTVRRNSTIEALRDPTDPEFQFSSLYDTVAGRVARYRLEGQADYFIPLFVRSTLKLSLRGGGIFSEGPVYANEQYRLGGNKRLRGFDEESLFATRFAIATLEYRLLLSQNAFLSAFTDYGYLENLTDRNHFFLRPWGLGAGLNLETQAGIFGISLAVGRRDAGQAVDWRAPKFHLGYVNLF